MNGDCAFGPSVANSGRRMHRALAVLASVVLFVLTLVPCVALAEVDTSGKPTGHWDTAPYWEDSDGNVIVGNTGEIKDWSNFPVRTAKSVSFQKGTVFPSKCNNMFRGDTLTSIDLSNVDFSHVTSIEEMFEDCDSLESIDLSNLDLSHVECGYFLFAYCDKLKTVNMSGINLSGLSSFDGIRCMFTFCKSLESVDLSGATIVSDNYSNMFQDCISLKSVNFAGSKISAYTKDGGMNGVGMSSMFVNCKSLEALDLSTFNTYGIRRMGNMFDGCTSLRSVNLSSFDTSTVTEMSSMFKGCRSLKNVDVSNFDTGNVTTMQGMFDGCSSLNSLNLSGFDTSKVTDMSAMFNNCSSFTALDLSSFDTSNVGKGTWDRGSCAKNMLSGCTSLKELKLSDGFYKASNDLRKSVALPDVSAMTGYDAGAYSGKWVRTDGSVPALASADLTGNAVPEGSSYAGTWIWQNARTLNYDANGGEGAPAAQPFWFGDRDAVSAEVPARASYDFLGWNTAADGSGVAVQPGGEIPYEAADGTALMDEKGLTLYAQWREQTYPITYDPTGGTWADGKTGTVAKAYGKASDSATALEGPARRAYDFIGWNTAADGTGTSYAKGAELPKGEDLTLYAQWREQTYTITYDPAGGTWADGTTGTVAKAYGKASDPAKILAAPTREGYKFVRWEGSSYQPGDAYDKRGEDGLLADDTLTAVWEEAPAPSGDKPGAGTTVPATGASDEPPARPGATAKAAPKVPETGDSGLGGIAAALAVLGAAALAGVAGIRLSSDRR